MFILMDQFTLTLQVNLKLTKIKLVTPGQEGCLISPPWLGQVLRDMWVSAEDITPPRYNK